MLPRNFMLRRDGRVVARVERVRAKRTRYLWFVYDWPFVPGEDMEPGVAVAGAANSLASALWWSRLYSRRLAVETADLFEAEAL